MKLDIKIEVFNDLTCDGIESYIYVGNEDSPRETIKKSFDEAIDDHIGSITIPDSNMVPFYNHSKKEDLDFCFSLLTALEDAHKKLYARLSELQAFDRVAFMKSDSENKQEFCTPLMDHYEQRS